MVPSWKDCVVSLGETSATKFRVYVAYTLVYEGVAQPPAGGGNCAVNIRDIVADYLHATTPEFSSGHIKSQPDIVKHVSVSIYEDDEESWTEVWNDEVIFDNSYDASRVLSAGIMQAPITNRIRWDQLVFYETLSGGTVTVSRSYAQDVDYTLTGVQLLPLSIFWKGEGQKLTIKVGGVTKYTFTTVDSGDHILYYKNAFGSFDSLLLEGNCVKSAGVERSTFKHVYQNTDTLTANTVNYRNGITDKWVLRTGWLTDDESSRMFHLLGSTEVYLHVSNDAYLNSTNQPLFPVRITDTSFEYKTFKGQGGKLIQYTMNAEVLRDYTRR